MRRRREPDYEKDLDRFEQMLERRREYHVRYHHRHRRFPHHHDHGPRRLQKQLFLSFGAAIFATFLVTGAVFSITRHFFSPGPWVPLAVMFVVGNVVWGLSGIAARHIAMPLRQLARVAHELGAGKLDRRVTLHWGAYEIRELADAFNEMANRIETQVKSQKELLGAVSHELRTPLARLRVLVGSLAETEHGQKLSFHMEREILELDALVGELLAGARVDAGALQRRDLDVADILRVCVERSGLPQTRLQIAPGAERVQADATLLSRALMVLLDNVRKHGGGKQITIVVDCPEEGATCFRVEDDGAGFDPDDIPKLFAPFARGRGESPDEHRGLGLGLYLVKRIAEAHGGVTLAENRAQGGASVGFTLVTELS